MAFSFKPTELPEVIEVETQSFGDERGFFSETFRARTFADAGIDVPFVQDNHSRSVRGVLRGLHYQLAPKAQAKLVRCVRGAIWDVAIDLRRDKHTYKRWVARELTESNRKMLFIPAGFAHGFYTMSDSADVEYKQSDYYSPEHERGIRWDDSSLVITWPLRGSTPILSEKDARYPTLANAEH
ncbi:MAG: dTDP-4-dehydrorhamnose 3,5-epimerase [Elusimicrobia bacterium]|nr:dTDP-4-dehydrorhamnose 3,5-epimerase [Elusimicrobiota bacterium]